MLSTKPPKLNQLESFVVKPGTLTRQRFPGQLEQLSKVEEHSGEFTTHAPIWSRQPFKLLYYAYFGLFLGFVLLPWFAVSSLLPGWRARPTWSFKRSFFVKLYRFGTRLTYRTYTSLSRDLSREVPHAETVKAKFVWVQPLPLADIRGEVKRAMQLQHINPIRTCGFWYGQRDGGGGVGQRAYDDEKVIYHLHGGAYWIGTAHESDVSASGINVSLLRNLAALPGSHTKRSFSLDYRLSVPGDSKRGSYPAALLDALAGYRYLLQECGFKPGNIVVAGDSAGGNLALSMCRALRNDKVDEMPGRLLLLSPWGDTSRSHSGPIETPNTMSTSWSNKDCDIITMSPAFRNTAVSALLGCLPDSETYLNPYLSPCSLQLDTEGLEWGFNGAVPQRVYISTGSAEISYDQHLTLAHRMAAATKGGVPIYTGDQLSLGQDAHELAARTMYPTSRHSNAKPSGTKLLPAEQEHARETIASDSSSRRLVDQVWNTTLRSGEERSVVLDECRDAVHDYLLFEWCEPERNRTWTRIAKFPTTREGTVQSFLVHCM